MDNYKQFFTLLAVLVPDKAEWPEARAAKALEYSAGRTSHLSELTPQEYHRLCNDMQVATTDHQQKAHEEAFRRELGSRLITWVRRYDNNIDTNQPGGWARLDAFLMQPRIWNGCCDEPKRYCMTTAAEREALLKKVRAIVSKEEKSGGKKPKLTPYQLN